MINKRLFGSDIPDKIKKKLEIRQAYAKTPNPGESLDKINEKYEDVDGIGLDNDFDNQADLSSRTPFVRMWTAVEIFNREISETNTQKFEVDVSAESHKLYKEEAQKAAKEVIKKNENENVSFDSLLWDSTKNAWILKSKEVLAEKQSFGKPEIYIVGNHTLNTLSSLNPNESIIDSTNDDEILEGVNRSAILPKEHKVTGDNNQYMKPPAGITGFSSTTEGMLGVMRTSTVNFTVHNFHDFESIYQRYFLRPGAQIFVDFGWNSKVLYDPENLAIHRTKETEEDTVTELTVEEMLYGEKDKGDRVNGYITEARGDLDTILGIVTNYDAKVLENGSVECSLEIKSKNVALLSEKFDKEGKRKKRIEHKLTTGVLFDGLYAISNDSNKLELDNQLKALEPKTEEQFNNGIKRNAKRFFSFKNLKLTTRNIKTGISIDDLGKDSNSIYISIGYFEDKILNSEFGVGKDINDINMGTDTQVRVDSSESFVPHIQLLKKRQYAIGKSKEKNPVFLYPEDWSDTFNTDRNKTPTYPEEAKDNEHLYDLELQRIPIRELFINTSIIINAMNSDNIVDVMKSILEEINKDSGHIFDLRISNNNTDNIISIVDTNYIPFERELKEAQDAYDNLFEFSVMSPNSIVKGYDLGFSMPEGGLANMYAIQGMSSDNTSQIFPINSMMDEGLALEALNTLIKLPKDEQRKSDFMRVGTGYFPDMGSEKANKETKNLKIDHRETYGYSRVDEILDTNIDITSEFDIQSLWFAPTNVSDDKEVTNEKITVKDRKTHKEKLDLNIEYMESAGSIVASTYSEYYLNEAKRNFLLQRSSPLPLTLSLTIYGISSLTPGDIFRVDYLPETYRTAVFFQVMKVSHTVDSSGWYTTLETQFRIRGKEKLKSNLYFKPTKISISPHRLDTDSKLTKDSGARINLSGTHLSSTSRPMSPNISHLTEYMSNIRIINDLYKDIDMAYEFVAISDEQEIETGLSYIMDYAISTRSKSTPQFGKYQLGTNNVGPDLIDSDIWETLGQVESLVESNASSEPVSSNGLVPLNLFNGNTPQNKAFIFISPIKLISGKKYHLLTHGHRWLLYTPGSQLINVNGGTLSVSQTKELVIQLLHTGKPIPKEETLLAQCEVCTECGAGFGGCAEEDCPSDYCIWHDGFFSNDCIPRQDVCYP